MPVVLGDDGVAEPETFIGGRAIVVAGAELPTDAPVVAIEGGSLQTELCAAHVDVEDEDVVLVESAQNRDTTANAHTIGSRDTVVHALLQSENAMILCSLMRT